MSLYGQFPNADPLGAAVCYMCGKTVKCSAADRHLSQYHSSSANPILPPPPPAPTVKLKSSHSKSKSKKEIPLPPPIIAEPDRPPPPVVTFPEEIRPAAAVVAPVAVAVAGRREAEPDRFPDAETTPAIRPGEVEVSVGDDDPPVVSIRESADLPLGDGLADDIMEIMNSEGIRSIEDLPDAAAWKNLMRDFSAVQQIDLRSAAALVDTPPIPAPVYALSGEAASTHFVTNAEPPPLLAPDRRRSPFPTPIIASAPVKPRSAKSSRPKHPAREYDPNRHCGVPSGDSRNPCIRSLTCKSHALSLRRQVDGRAKTFDVLLAEHRASKPTAPTVPPPAPAPPARLAALPVPAPEPPPPPIRTPVEVAFAALSPDRMPVDYFSVAVAAAGEPPMTVIPAEADLISLLPPEVAEALAAPPAPPPSPPRPPEPRPQHVYWYPTEPRPLAACGFSSCRMGGALFLGRRLATVRGDLKAALARSRSDDTTGDYFNFNQNSVPSGTKNVHPNSSSKAAAPQVRRLVMSCPALSGGERGASFGPGKRNGHLFSVKRPIIDDYDDGDTDRMRGNSVTKVSKRAAPPDMMDLNFMFDPLMADEKC